MWSKKDKDGDTILVATHVDDSIVTGSNDDKTDTFVREMLDRFDGTCERNLTEMLGAISRQALAFYTRRLSRRSC
jgi:hypothetical protein